MFKNPEWASLIDAKLADGVVLALSMPRLSAYGSLPIESVARHGRNITLCEATYPVLHLLEVVMRNRIHDAFSAHFGALDWYEQGYWNHERKWHGDAIARQYLQPYDDDQWMPDVVTGGDLAGYREDKSHEGRRYKLVTLDMAPDGRRVLFTGIHETAEVWTIKNLLQPLGMAGR